MNRSLLAAAVLIAAAALPAFADDSSSDDTRKRLDELERASHAENEALRRRIDELERQIDERRPAPESDESFVGPFLEKGAGARQRNEEADPLERLPKVGEDLQGNVFSGPSFKIKLGGSLRMHAQYNTTPVGESVSKALLPDPKVPGGGDEVDRESFRAFAGRTRLNLAVQGPDTLGGKTLGFFEMDFAQENSGGESGAISPNPRIRHAYMRWSFKELAAAQELLFTIGQTGSAADLMPDTVDFNTMLSGLGATHRRNPRIEAIHRIDVTRDWKFSYGVGAERPYFGNDAIAKDLGPGDLSGYPAFSGGVGMRSNGRIGASGGFGANVVKFVARSTYGEFVERFQEGTYNPNLGLEQGFTEREFQNIAVHGGFVLEGIGFNPDGRARTLNITINGLYSQGDALHLDASFDRRTVLTKSGSLDEAESAGGFVSTSFFLLDELSLRWSGGGQVALRSDLVPVTGTFDQGYVRDDSYQSEVSVWWTPGPFTFALAWNHTETDYRKIDAATGARDDRGNDNDKVEFISWFSF
jgi:hypothetical protein